MRYQFSPTAGEIIWFTDDGNTFVIRQIDEAEWSAYQAWLEEGNVTEPFDDGRATTLLDASRDAAERLHRAADAQLRPVTSQYPTGEVLSWPVQLAEASQWLVDPAAPTPLVDSLCDAAGKAEMCHAIIAKGAHYATLCGQVIAWRRACSVWIEGCTDAAALAAWQPQYPEVPF
jgi:hypothetical protein